MLKPPIWVHFTNRCMFGGGGGGGAWDQELEKPLGSHSRIKVAPVMTIRRLIEAIIFQKTFCKCMLVIVISYYSQ